MKFLVSESKIMNISLVIFKIEIEIDRDNAQYNE